MLHDRQAKMDLIFTVHRFASIYVKRFSLIHILDFRISWEYVGMGLLQAEKFYVYT